jgi:ribosomal-protein-alanine N-acetyltransferase
MARVAADEAEVLTLGVVLPARRHGLGRTLLDEGHREAFRRGALRMFLEVAAGNIPARNLYAAAGYTEVGQRAAYYPDGSMALVLGRPLTAGAAKRA